MHPIPHPPHPEVDVLDGIPLDLLNGLGGMALWTVIGYLMLTDRLVWHTRLRKSEQDWQGRLEREQADRERWEGIALRALGVAEKMTVHAEVTSEVLSAIPVPPTAEEAAPS